VAQGGAFDTVEDVRALLLENLHPLASSILTEAGIEVESRPGALSEDELVGALDRYDLLGIRSKTEVTARVLDSHPHLVAVGAFCIGTNQIDLEAATRHGIAAFNAPYSNTRSVVELAIANIIAMARRLTERDKALHAGIWDKSSEGSHEVRGRTLGIVGYGNIGSQLSVVAEMLGMQVYFYDTDEKLALGNARRCSSLEELLDAVETVTLHVDGRGGNAGIFGREQIQRMRPRSLFLNLSRGFVVDYEALRDALVAGHVAGAAVDVFPVEPRSRGDAFDSPLRGLPNVILTPHVGGSTEEAQEDIGRFVGTKLRDYVHTGTTTLSVNLPTLTPARNTHAQRIAHIHQNTPGVLAHVNQVLAEHDVNIGGQVLATRGQTGYVVTDTGSGLSSGVLAALRSVPETVRLRVID
jgi:D-3-phosphoglycerate dehydrogenase